MNILQKAWSVVSNFLHLGGATAAQTAALATPAVNAKIEQFEGILNNVVTQIAQLATLGAEISLAIPGIGPIITLVLGYLSGAVKAVQAVETTLDAALNAAEKAGGYTGAPIVVPGSGTAPASGTQATS